MNRLEALTIFNRTEETISEWEEAYEEQCFEIRQFFLQRAPVIPLINAKIKKLEVLRQAADRLSGNHPAPIEKTPQSTFVWQTDNAVNLIRSYENQLAEIRAALAKEYQADGIIHHLSELIAFQESWDNVFLEFINDYLSESANAVMMVSATDTESLRKAALILADKKNYSEAEITFATTQFLAEKNRIEKKKKSNE